MKKEQHDTPFGSLPEFVKTHNIHLKECAEIVVPVYTGDDTHLFSRAMEGVKIVNSNKKRVLKRQKAEQFRQPSQNINSRKLLEEAMLSNQQLNVTSLPEFMEGFIKDINPITMEKLRKGEFSVQKTLDLHGCSIDNAGEQFQLFIKNAVREGLKCVKVIHGRGLKSKGIPVLKEYLKTWIIKAMHRKWIVAFSNALMNDGGPGATYILLKRYPSKKQIHIIG